MDDTNTQTPPTDPLRTTRSPQTPMSELVIQAIADAEECDPSMVAPPLYDALDPEALDALYVRASPRIEFDYADYHIEVTPARRVTVQTI
ncbi:HalOD1 output domain-containing protein [Haladaptatus caseinilyticus]|uniref:HalOD1 output domain-containing protein n=1 Tax=Haladaptatus caseinilyticus TaxID=2993314 RepID=UPI00224B2743|nr:HalOD1 output domain-containing protein [Haladaptatus caseinilyticus]